MHGGRSKAVALRVGFEKVSKAKVCVQDGLLSW